MFGRKAVFFAGVGLFVTGAVLCGFVWGMIPLIGFRAIEGLGAGAVQPIASTILGDIYSPSERAHVQGLVSSVFGVSVVIGPTLGAFLIQHVSWSVVFLMNVPIGLIAAIMVGLCLRETNLPRSRKIDWFGAFLTLLAAGGLTLVRVPGGRWPFITNATIRGIAALVAIWLIAHERTTEAPMLPLELGRHNRILVADSMDSFAAAAMMMAITAYMPAYVQAIGWGALAGSSVLGAMSDSWAVSSILAARLIVKTSYRLVAVLGPSALIPGCVILILAPPSAGPIPAAIGSVIIGAAMGGCMSVFIVSIQASVPWRDRGAATSSAKFLRFMGQMIGVSACGALLNATIRSVGPTSAYSMDKLLDAAGRATLPPAELPVLNSVFATGLRGACILAALFALGVLLFSCLLPPRRNPRTHIVPD